MSDGLNLKINERSNVEIYLYQKANTYENGQNCE